MKTMYVPRRATEVDAETGSRKTLRLAEWRALDAYARTRELAAIAPRVSLDPAATIFQIGGILASVP